ncbi:MAG: DUF1150 family protein [Alphaproteobacteria bacterium]
MKGTSAMNALDDPRAMSERELAILGLNDLAYVTQVVVDGKHAYLIYAADGTMIDVMDDRDLAFAAARQHDLDPVSVH